MSRSPPPDSANQLLSADTGLCSNGDLSASARFAPEGTGTRTLKPGLTRLSPPDAPPTPGRARRLVSLPPSRLSDELDKEGASARAPGPKWELELGRGRCGPCSDGREVDVLSEKADDGAVYDRLRASDRVVRRSPPPPAPETAGGDSGRAAGGEAEADEAADGPATSWSWPWSAYWSGKSGARGNDEMARLANSSEGDSEALWEEVWPRPRLRRRRCFLWVGE
jgi:hypothetical protein